MAKHFVVIHNHADCDANFTLTWKETRKKMIHINKGDTGRVESSFHFLANPLTKITSDVCACYKYSPDYKGQCKLTPFVEKHPGTYNTHFTMQGKKGKYQIIFDQ